LAISFPNESAQYRTARNRLLEQEIALRRAMEAVAAARRELPPGGPVAEDYVFDGLAPDGSLTKIRLSELFESGRSSLVIYNMMFPRDPGDQRAGPDTGEMAKLPLAEGPCPSCVAFLDQLDGAVDHAAQHLSLVVVAKAPLNTSSPSPENAGGCGFGWSRQPATRSSATTTEKRPTAFSARC
jgi:predicted dithiol-disulfide oxidoreductase (DUF899 family)